MKRSTSLFAGLLLLSAANAQSLPGDPSQPQSAKAPQKALLPSSRATPSRFALSKTFGSLPLAFEPNQGQADRSVRFLSHNLGASLSLTSAEAVFKLPAPPQAGRKGSRAPQASRRAAFTTVRMQLLGAASHASALQQQPLAGRVNYFTNRDPKQWHTDIPTFGKVGFQDVYPGVDVVYYGNGRHLEYDFVVAPHADPRQIALHFAGAQQVHVSRSGDLVVQAPGRELTWQKPVVYQQDANGKLKVAAHFRLKHLPNGQTAVRFALGRYDTSRPLIIDPVLTYSSRLEGIPSANASLALDSAGSVYVAGTTDDSRVHGVTYVLKMNPAGTAPVYLTYLGTTSFSIPAIAVDSSGSAYVAMSGMQDFPTTTGAYKTTQTDGTNLAVAKLNPSGSALVYSTFIGNNKINFHNNGLVGVTPNAGMAIAVDSSGSAYVTGSAGSGFPTTAGAFQTTCNAPSSANAFVTKLNPAGSALVYSTYLGGKCDLGQSTGDTGQGIAVDGSGNAYIVGATTSTDFPTTAGAFQKVNKAAANNDTAFVTKLNPTGTSLVYSTLLGGSGDEAAYGIAIDGAGDAYVTGLAGSTDFPVTPGAYQTSADGYTAFITKLDPSGASLLYSTRAGNTNVGFAIAIDSLGYAYVTGKNMGITRTTIGSFQRSGGESAFVFKLNPAGSALVYSTLLGDGSFGGLDTEVSGQSIAVDSNGSVYVAGRSGSSASFPITPNAYQSVNGVSTFLTKLAPVNIFPDFNNDGSTDLLFQNASSGQIGYWLMQGAAQVGGDFFSQTPPADYTVAGIGYFPGLSTPNALVLQSATTNQVAFWFVGGSDGKTITNGAFLTATPATDWKVVGVGDFNLDGKSDLVFQNQTTGQVNVWFMNGYAYQGGATLAITPLAGWKVVGVGDFNKDGFPDLLFQNQTSGQLAIWYLNGTAYTGGTLLPTVPAAGWKVVSVGDYNGDGDPDLVFQNDTTNQAVIWYMKNGAFMSGEAFSQNPAAGWKIVGPR